MTRNEKIHHDKLRKRRIGRVSTLKTLLKRPRSVGFLAKTLDVNERTVYRFLKEIPDLCRQPGRDPVFWIKKDSK